MTTALTCPKCAGAMRSYERNGVTIDQCADCRGVFLDRGELDRLIDAESRYSSAAAPGSPPAQQRATGKYDERGYGKPHKKRRSFLSELFDD